MVALAVVRAAAAVGINAGCLASNNHQHQACQTWCTLVGLLPWDPIIYTMLIAEWWPELIGQAGLYPQRWSLAV